MNQYLPRGGFKWILVAVIKVIRIPNDSEFGYILEVDLEYPKDLNHIDLVSVPEIYIDQTLKKQNCSPLSATERNMCSIMLTSNRI
jgi:hypothetical protein